MSQASATPAVHAHGIPQTITGAHRGRLAAVLAIVLSIVVVEVVGAAVSGSLALLADAGHMLVDAAAVGLALLATTLAQRPPTATRTFGWQRAEILAAVLNGVLLLAVAGLVFVEAVQRLADPPEVEAGLMLAVALVGLVANGVSLALLHQGQRHSLNVRGAYLEVLGDLLGSGAVVVGAAVVAVTGSSVADPVASLFVALLILPRTFALLRRAVDVLLESSPEGIDLEEVRAHMLDVDGVVDVHDLHAWTITSGMPVLSAHVVVDEATLAGTRGGTVLDRLGVCLSDHFDVDHCTFQLEPVGHREHEPPPCA